MEISVVYGYTCPSCSCPLLGLMTYSVRVNKGSLRTRGGAIGLVPPRCGDCGADIDQLAASSWWIDGADRDALNAARMAKGWPPLTEWRVSPRAVGALDHSEGGG
jgi:hypothetical protein